MGIKRITVEKKRTLIKAISIISICLLVLVCFFVYRSQKNNSGKSQLALTDVEEHQSDIPEGYKPINNAQDLRDIANDITETGKYILMQDIDLDNETWDVIATSSSNAFKGILDGNNYTISKV